MQNWKVLNVFSSFPAGSLFFIDAERKGEIGEIVPVSSPRITSLHAIIGSVRPGLLYAPVSQ
jgi:hypothetical protein